MINKQLSVNNVYLSLGSNIGDREGYISKTLLELQKIGEILQKSSLYETEPVGYKNQAFFLNKVVKISTPLDFLEFTQSIEKIQKKFGKNTLFKNGPRTIDIDILFWNKEVFEKNGYIIPHPRLHERKFVLEPFFEIAPLFVHPIIKKTIKTLFSEL